MRNHLHLKHKIQINAKRTKAHVPSLAFSSTGKSRIDNFFRPVEDSERIVAKLAAVDRVSFNTIAIARQMRHAFPARGYKLPDTERHVRNLVVTFFSQLKSNVKETIKMKKWAGKFCSITLDEYTSTRNRRYMNLNLHCDEEHIEEK